MVNRFWIKVYTGMLEDPQQARLPDRLWRRALELNLLAGKHGDDGSLPPLEVMAWRLRLAPAKLLADLRALAERGLLRQVGDAWQVCGFSDRQSAMAVAGRVRQCRERKYDVTDRYKECNEEETEAVDEHVNHNHLND